MRTVFLRALEAEGKAAALLTMIRVAEAVRNTHRFEVDLGSFASIPKAPFAYWVSDRIRRLFAHLTAFEAEGRTAKQGLATADDFRFVRAWWAVRPVASPERWFPFVKGGAFAPYYADVRLLVGYSRGDQIGLMAIGRYGRGADFYFRPGFTWPLRGARFSAQAVPSGCIFSVAGKMAFVGLSELSCFHALMNSSAFAFLIRVQSDAVRIQFEAGLVQGTPVPDFSAADHTTLGNLARRAWALKRSLDTRNEVSRAFTLPALLQVGGAMLADRAAAWSKRVSAAETELVTIQAEIDARCFELYGIDEADRRAITEGLGDGSTTTYNADTDAADPEEADGDTEPDSDEAEDSAADIATLAAELVSWAAGVAFGRFDIRLATGARVLPPEPEPFDPLPVCSPAMLTGEDGMPLSAAPAGYPLTLPEGGIVVDDPGHSRDLTTAVRAVFDTVFGDAAHARWNEAIALLDPRAQDLRGWLARSFFEHHLKRYSKSRRKAPIFWQLGTASSRYSVWIYAHRIGKDTFFQVQNDFVAPKLAHEQRKLDDLRQAAGPSPSASQRKEIAEQEALVEELRTMLDEVKRIAPLWRPDLDDGVVLTMALLWRLVPQHKPWQKELKAAWEALAAGKYDWAHLAMHLWPDRVVPKCREDRSLAIAHGLEDVLWVQDFDDKWRPRRGLDDTIAHVVDHHCSPALQTAVSALRAFWKQRFADAGRSDAQWWMELEAGMHDDAPIALALWPGRVLEKAAKDSAIARAHRLEVAPSLPAVAAAGPGKRRKMREERAPQLSAAELSMVAAFCGDLEDQPSWAARWQAWDAGAFDDRSPLALHVRTSAVVQRATEDQAVALTFGLERWFWVETNEGMRRLREPEEELRQAIARRESVTVKAALTSLLEAPTPGAGGAQRGGRRRRGDAG